jgi:hypothetical protein
MAQDSDITTPVTEIALNEQRAGELTFTVSNATTASIRGESVIIPGPGAQLEWFTVDRPVRTYQRGQADQVSVAVAVPADAPPGSYSFLLRTLLGGGVPEEDFDDSPSVSFTVPEPPAPPPPPPPKKPFPWWILLVIGGIVLAVIVIGAIVFVVTRPPEASPSPSPSPTPQPLPDLVIGRPTISGTRLTIPVTNNGNAPAGTFDVSVIVDRSPFLVGPDFADADTVAGLPPGQSASVSFNPGFTFDLDDVSATVDPQNLIRESSESNNRFGNRRLDQIPDFPRATFRLQR